MTDQEKAELTALRLERDMRKMAEARNMELIQERDKALGQLEKKADLLDEALNYLDEIIDAYENGPDCYEEPDGPSGYLGKAILIDSEKFNQIVCILNKYRPQATMVTNKEG